MRELSFLETKRLDLNEILMRKPIKEFTRIEKFDLENTGYIQLQVSINVKPVVFFWKILFSHPCKILLTIRTSIHIENQRPEHE